MNEAQRAQFEKWVVTQPELTYNGSLQRAGDGYAYGPTEIAWRGYAAGAADENEACAKILDALVQDTSEVDCSACNALYAAAKKIRSRGRSQECMVG